jgi:hypothetical protein
VREAFGSWLLALSILTRLRRYLWNLKLIGKKEFTAQRSFAVRIDISAAPQTSQ